MTLPDTLHAEITSLSKIGDTLADQRQFDAAIAQYEAAFHLLPKPPEEWDAATWLLAAIGDAKFSAGDTKAAFKSFSHAMHCPNAIGNPFLHLRLGQCRLLLGDEMRAADELARAYAMGGVEVFQDEDPRFLEFLDTKIVR